MNLTELKEIFRSFVVFLITLEARAIIAKYKPRIIAVTGSVGKTSSKDAVFTALSSSFFVRKSEKSFNSDIGVPLTVLGVPNGWANPLQWLKNLVEGLFLIVINAPYPKWLVVEVGADRPGDITRSLSWLSPHVVVGTRFPDVPVHVEFYASPSDVAKEEMAPLYALQSGGVAVVSAEDERSKNLKLKDGVRKIVYGFEESADVKGSRFLITSKNKMPAGISFDVAYRDERAHIVLPGILGRTHAYAALAGIAAAVAVEIPLEKAADAFQSHQAPAGRTRLISGIKGSVVIDDTYNSSPVAAEEALGILESVPRIGKRIAVLGDMLELGSYSVSEHARIGKLVSTSADVLITVGVRAQGIAEGALSAGMPEAFVFKSDHSADAASKLVSMIGEGDVTLVKGSQGMRMERVVKSVMAEPAQAKNLLVRQDTEWSVR